METPELDLIQATGCKHSRLRFPWNQAIPEESP
jgi:hypothetical protein